MHKHSLFTMSLVMACLILATSSVLAGSNCAKKTSTSCAATCATPCPISKAAPAKAETPANPACADYKGTCEHLTLTVTGMTDANNEAEVKKALEGQDGVISVTAVDHKTGTATVCFDPNKAKSEHLAKLVARAGFKADVVSSQVCSHDKNGAARCPMMKATASAASCTSGKSKPAKPDKK